MNDQAIIKLFCYRNEQAISQADQKYERGCRKIALEILGNVEDAEEISKQPTVRTL